MTAFPYLVSGPIACCFLQWERALETLTQRQTSPVLGGLAWKAVLLLEVWGWEKSRYFPGGPPPYLHIRAHGNVVTLCEMVLL